MGEVYEIYVKTHFSAAHRLDGYDGDCARVHGHNWLVEVYVKCSRLDGVGLGIDFRDIKQALKQVLSQLDHCNLNKVQPFTSVNPTSENIAKYLYREMAKKLDGDSVRVSKIKVSETPGAGAFYWEE
jgi:6-pyruvoyltetrahydropterin/6-carboxytetrahydropterin synthase